MNPKVTVKSKSALTKRMLPLVHRNLKEAMAKILERDLPQLGGVAFTSDIWSSRALNSYIALTMHYVDKDWNLRKFLMGCSNFDERHTAAEIGQKLDRMIEAINIPGEASLTMITDGGSNMVKAAKESPNIHDHLICLCHIISNCLKDTFEIPAIKEAINMLKELASCTHKSLQRTLEIKKECINQNIPFVKIINPVPTRWNSVVMSLKTVVRITPALKKLHEKELEIFRGKLPTNKQLDSYGQMLGPLMRIKTLSEEMEADKKPTIHLALTNLGRLGTISRSKKFQTSSITTRMIVEAFEEALQRRVKDLGRRSSLYCMANVLHPTYKGSLLNFDGDDATYDLTINQIKALFPEVQPESQDSQSQAQVSC